MNIESPEIALDGLGLSLCFSRDALEFSNGPSVKVTWIESPEIALDGIG